ncbi:DUF501 domain-containing protein [Euzebya sp.]|uniref:DUF501 domain-containing protein n=1 Tax=Euzebya sp. TaxID=1971409 RepID=UPI0035118542
MQPPDAPDPTADALTAAADAGYEAQATRPEMDADDRALAAQMIGRPLRGRSAAAVRCGWGLPAVLRVDPALPDGTPFPTAFWLACPLASSHVGTLEASGVMQDLSRRVQDPDDLAPAHRAAGQRYVAFRNALGPRVPRDPAAGGMPDRVKCLHSLYAHHLATRDSAVGAWVAERLEPMPCPAPCATLPEGRAGGDGHG